MNKNNLPKTIPVFPLSNFIIFPKTTVPLNIFEPRYIEMINDSMKSNKLIGLIQPKKYINNDAPSALHEVGCLGKITSFKETEDGRYIIEIKGLIRFKIIQQIKSLKPYRIYEINFMLPLRIIFFCRKRCVFSGIDYIGCITYNEFFNNF